jgi:hypothetical protein
MILDGDNVTFVSAIKKKNKKKKKKQKKKKNKQQLFRFTYLYIKKKCITLLQQRMGRSKQACLQHTKGGGGEAQSEPAAPTSPAHHAGWMVCGQETLLRCIPCLSHLSTTVVSYVLTIHMCMYVPTYLVTTTKHALPTSLYTTWVSLAFPTYLWTTYILYLLDPLT